MNFGRLFNVNEVPEEAQLAFIKAPSPIKQHLKKPKVDNKSKDITSSNIFNLNIQDQSATMVLGEPKPRLEATLSSCKYHPHANKSSERSHSNDKS